MISKASNLQHSQVHGVKETFRKKQDQTVREQRLKHT